jgi:hypothetical protein
MPHPLLLELEVERRQRIKEELLRRMGYQVTSVPYDAGPQQVHTIVAASARSSWPPRQHQEKRR